MTTYRRWGKRVLDLVIAGAASLVLFPPALLCGAIMKLCSHGPLFYAQWRIGYRGAPFRIWKLRTMHMDASSRLEHYLAQHPEQRATFEREQCLARDPRVIGAVGRFCRAYSIDEIPQLLNVLKGEMSVVGPRPLTADDTERFVSPAARDIRLTAKPGLTGLWQVSRTGKSDISRNLEELDLLYLRTQSFRLDLLILLRTVPAVLGGGGQY